MLITILRIIHISLTSYLNFYIDYGESTLSQHLKTMILSLREANSIIEVSLIFNVTFRPAWPFK